MASIHGKKQYKCLIFDADHTLLNYVADEYAAFSELYRGMGMPVSQELLDKSRFYSEETWTEAGLYDVDKPQVQATYHEVYRSHVTGIFEKVFRAFGNPTGVSAQEAGRRFLRALEGGGREIGKARETVETLSKRYDIRIATNGLTEIQGERLKAFAEYAKIYVSEAVGCIKPLPDFFRRILRDGGYAAEECLMIGDSLRSDIYGAQSVGIDGCWFNPDRRENTTDILPKHEIATVEALYDIL